MRTLSAIAVACLLAVTLAGCADDVERYPNGVPTTSTTSRSSTATGTATASSSSGSASGTTSSSGTTTGSGPAAPTAGLTAAPGSGAAPLNVTFSLSGSDANGDPLTWTLVFGDGNQTNGTTLPTTVAHQFTKAGNFTASLTVSDGALNRTATAKVSVTGPSAPAGPTAADLCPTDALAVGHEMAGYYVTPADTASSPGSFWVYEESNGMPGLQRNDETVPTQCPTPDTIIL